MPLLSIVIPTHNRARYAAQAARIALDCGPDVEVVICDSSSEGTLRDDLAELAGAGRLIYRNTASAHTSVVDNFTAGFDAASGEYLVFIGDDDFVTQDIVTIARWAKDRQVDAVRFNFPALFYWDDFASTTRWAAEGATITVAPFSGRCTPFDAGDELRRALANLGGGVFGMPRAYAGMIARDLAQRIVARHGALFGGVSPDIFSSSRIALAANRCVAIDYPAIIPGASGRSTSGQSARGTHRGTLRDNDHIRPFVDLVWDPLVPEFYSVPTVWAFSLLKAIEHDRALLSQANFGKLYLKCLLASPANTRDVWTAFRANRRLADRARVAAQFAAATLTEGWRLTAGRIIARRRPGPQPARVLPAPDAFAAVATLHDELRGGQWARLDLDMAA